MKNAQLFALANSPQRAHAIDRLFADLGEVIGPKERNAYMLMEPGAFGLLEAKLRQLARRLSSAQEAFSARSAAIHAVQPGGNISARDIYAARSKLH